MTDRAAHRYASSLGSDGDSLTCACGHAEPISGDLVAAVGRMNAHIRASYSDEEWEAKMQGARLATLDTATGELSLPARGPKS